MFGSAVVYTGLAILLAGAICCVRPISQLGVPTRARAAMIAAGGAALAVIGLALPARESRIGDARMRLDAFAPVWQFNETHPGSALIRMMWLRAIQRRATA